MLSSANFERSRKPVRYFSDNETARRERDREKKALLKEQNKHRKEVRSRWETWTSTETL